MVTTTISSRMRFKAASVRATNARTASVSKRRTLPPAVAVSTIAFALQPQPGAALGPDVNAGSRTTLWIPLVRRTRLPFRGLWALPGGPTQWNETLTDTALRTLNDVTRSEPGYLEQLYSFGGIERSAKAQRLVTIAYWALYGEHQLGHEAVKDKNLAWFSADQLPALAFDHAEIVAHALDRLRVKTGYAEIAHRFLGPEFTLGQLRAVHEAILDESVDAANFRRQALARGTLVDTGRQETGGAHRPSRLYRFREASQPLRSPP